MDETNLENVVQKSSNYKQFSFLNANRETNRGHVEALKKAFVEHGNLTEVQPILVNGRFQIIDGQHRFIACRELRQPIYFTVVEGLNITDALSMNVLHRRWETIDYIHSYAELGNQNYQILLQLLEDYGFSVGNTSMFVAGRKDTAGYMKDLRTGDFVVEDEVAARDRLQKLADVTEITDDVGRTAAKALLEIILGNEDYDHARMLRKLAIRQPNYKRYADRDSCLHQFEDIYNFGYQTRTRLY